jgi:signal transduction histidine kinase
MNFFCDETFVYRIVLNIVSNAINFTDKGGITIDFCIESIDNINYISLYVIDTGIGIDNEYHGVIFEPFSRIGSTSISKRSGLGLGLSNVKKMLDVIDGRIFVSSDPGNGSEFRILFRS